MSEQPPPYSAVQADVKHGPPQDSGPYPAQAGYPPQHAGYPPQQAGYPQGQYPVGGAGGYAPVVTQQPATTVVVVTNVHYRETPVNTVCQFCNQQVITRTSYHDGTLTWLLCVGLCVVGCDLGCCLVPFCVDGCKDVIHMCPSCNRKLGRFSRI